MLGSFFLTLALLIILLNPINMSFKVETSNQFSMMSYRNKQKKTAKIILHKEKCHVCHVIEDMYEEERIQICLFGSPQTKVK